MLGLIYYLRFILKNKKILREEYNINIDRFFRMWTVVNVPVNKHHNLKTYGYALLDFEIKEYITKLDDFFIRKSVMEIIALKDLHREDSLNALIIIEYKKFNLSNFFFWFYSIMGVSLLTGLIIFLIKII